MYFTLRHELEVFIGTRLEKKDDDGGLMTVVNGANQPKDYIEYDDGTKDLRSGGFIVGPGIIDLFTPGSYVTGFSSDTVPPQTQIAPDDSRSKVW